MQRPRKNHKADDKLGLDANALHGSAAQGVLVADNRYRILFCSPESESLLRLKPGATKRRGTLLPVALRKIVRKTLAANQPVTNRTIAMGTRGAFQASAMPIQLRPRIRAVVIVLQDLATDAKTQSKLHHLDRLANLGTLSAGMTHEIKNAFVSVKTFVDLLLEKNQDAELAEVVRREMSRIDSIIGQMLKYSGPAHAAFSPVRVHDVLDHSLRMVQPQLKGRLISLNRSFNASPDGIKGDDYQLEQAFVNLLLNAIEAIGANGSLTVATDIIFAPRQRKSVSASGAQVRIAIADTGVGIPAENMKRLFEPFFTTKPQGTGLGLAIARRIVQEHHGDITVQTQVDKGTTFNVLLPVSVAAH